MSVRGKLLRMAARDNPEDPHLDRIARRFETQEKAVFDFLRRNDEAFCAFLLVERQNFASPRNLFGSRSPVLTGRRISVIAGRKEGQDVVPGDEILSVLMTDEAFASLTFSSGAYASAATLDRFHDARLPHYDRSWRDEIENLAAAAIGSKSQGDLVRQMADRVDDEIARNGYLPKASGKDYAFSLDAHVSNLFLNAEYALTRYAEARRFGAASDRISMSSAVTHADAIISEMERESHPALPPADRDVSTGPLFDHIVGTDQSDQAEILSATARKIFGRWLVGAGKSEAEAARIIADIGSPAARRDLAQLLPPDKIFGLLPYLHFRTNDLGDLSEWCVRSTQSSGSTPGFHSDMPDTGHAINLRFGLPDGMKDGGIRNLDHGDHLNIDREILDISVTQKEMILAIEGGQHGDPVRCQMRRLSGFVTQEPRYVGPWSDMGEMTGVSTRFTEDMPEYADIPSKAKEISDAMALGASGRRGAPALPGMLRDLAADMDAASDRFVTVSSPQRRAIGEAVDEMAVRSVSGSGILAAWGRISDRMARLIGRSDHGPDF